MVWRWGVESAVHIIFCKGKKKVKRIERCPDASPHLCTCTCTEGASARAQHVVWRCSAERTPLDHHSQSGGTPKVIEANPTSCIFSSYTCTFGMKWCGEDAQHEFPTTPYRPTISFSFHYPYRFAHPRFPAVHHHFH